MAQVDCDAVCGVAKPAQLPSANDLPSPSELGIPPGMVQDLASRAVLAADLKSRVSAAALAAIPAIGGGTALARGAALLTKLRDRVQSAEAMAEGLRHKGKALEQDAAATLAAHDSAPKAQALEAIGAARAAAEEARATAVAVEQAVRDGLAKGQTDVKSLIASVQGAGDKLTGMALQMSEAAKARIAVIEAGLLDRMNLAQASLTRLGVAPVVPPIDAARPDPRERQPRDKDQDDDHPGDDDRSKKNPPEEARPGQTLENPMNLFRDRWASLRDEAVNGLPSGPNFISLNLPALPGWRSLQQAGMTDWRSRMKSEAASRWTSLRAGLLAGALAPPPMPTFNFNVADPWGELWNTANLSVDLPILPALPQLPSLPAPPEGRIELPPVDAAAMAALAAAAEMFRELFGRSLAEPGALDDLAETMESLDDCLSEQAPITPEAQTHLAEWASLASSVRSVRDQMKVDLSLPNMGEAWTKALAALQQAATGQGFAAWQQERARAISEWLSLDRAAAALDMPVNGTDALGELGDLLNRLADYDLPSISDMVQLGSLLSMLDSLRRIRDGFGVDALRAGAASRLRNMADQVRSNLQGRMDSFATMASAAQGMTHASLERFARIDRAQAAALGLETLTMDRSPIMSQAPAALATLNTARAIRQRSPMRPGRGRPRRARRR
ncbi:MAG: hypothetical protein INF79_01290 [Roseomonas sp.]|nr:hypothetical protein [Roseomonas sp.]